MCEEALDFTVDESIDRSMSASPGFATVFAAFMAASESEAQGWRIQGYNCLK